MEMTLPAMARFEQHMAGSPPCSALLDSWVYDSGREKPAEDFLDPAVWGDLLKTWLRGTQLVTLALAGEVILTPPCVFHW